jgi:hypothetical protein
MTKLCPRGKAAAKRKFKVYPSAYANAYASRICAGKIKDPSGVKRKDFKGPKRAMGGRIMKAGGGLMEATARLKRQGLKDGKKVFPTNPSIEQEVRDYYTKNFGSKKAKAELSERTRDRKKVKKMGGGMIMKRPMYRKGGGVCLRGMNREAVGKNS